VPGFRDSTVLAHSADAIQFIKDQYRHCKPILVLGNGRNMIESAGVKLTLPSGELDPGILYFQNDNFDDILPQFIEAIAAHRHFEREIEPPLSM
jgi:catalase